MTLPHMVEFGDLRILGGEGSDGVYLSGLSGWDDLPDGRGSPDDIPQAHGSFPRSRVWRASKAPTATGAIVAPTRERAEQLRTQMKTLGALATSMTVTDLTGRWTSAAEVEDISFNDPGAWSTYIPFTIDVLVTDPVRYTDLLMVGPVGLPTQSGGLFLPAALPWDLGMLDMAVADVVNTGSLPVLPVVRLTGSASSVVIHGGPRTVSFGAFDGELVIDNLQRRAFLNGADVTRSLILRNWHQIPAGESHGFFFEAVAPSPGASMTVEYRIGEW